MGDFPNISAPIAAILAPLTDMGAAVDYFARLGRFGFDTSEEGVTTALVAIARASRTACDAEMLDLATADALRQALEEARFTDLDMRDETEIMIDHARKARERGLTPSPEHMMANQVVMGDDFLDRRSNVIAGMEMGALRRIAVLAYTRLDG